MRLGLGVLVAVLGAACGPALSADRVRVEKLPSDLQEGPAMWALKTPAGFLFASPSNGGFRRLTKDRTSWELLSDRAMIRSFPDFKAGLALAEGAGAGGIFRNDGEQFVSMDPPVPVLPADPFASTGFAYLRGRDPNGVYWATFAPSFGARDGKLVVAHLDPAAPTEWVLDEVPLASVRHTLPASASTLTGDGRLFFRPLEGGLWQVDVTAKQTTEVVTCDHELFRPSMSDYVKCQEDAVLATSSKGDLFILNAHKELWRLPPGSTTPALVLKAGLEKLPLKDEAGFSFYGPIPQLHVDAKDRVWLGFRWGNNSSTDQFWLYAADPANDERWHFINGELPPNLMLFGHAATPLLSSGRLETGFLLYDVIE